MSVCTFIASDYPLMEIRISLKLKEKIIYE